ncbi:peptidoglycan-associated lipoprotein Pal [Pseudoblastomonas halimionae]|uniref:Peptidoglycan-associated lipoprotein n=1 Tax=Alteriqipengyuania halimionae TaxID=1926630 RepID=A0A6I4U0Y5_9SPHN|nr:peptidoglycan-associated lipoprotein Pal [Alteriqipengyuania halimionae]MXP08613.1 peptidoglycan-associated lipoprotein Pal [Alteriqipengyuania halimionae]
MANWKYVAPLAMAVAVAGCSKKAPEDLPPQPVDTSTGSGQQDNAGSGISDEIVPGSQRDFVNFTRGQDTVYFDTDRYNIDSEAAARLQTQVQWLMRYPNKRITIEGHTDERGTRDYNLALGERRANAAKNYLVGLGVQPGRITTVSYGKERPKALGSNEAAWAQNRRAVTVTID